jgi:SAM-dependent methyltransferase
MQPFPMEPLSDDHGFDRGTPLDRRYIESFLAGHEDAVHGAVLEVGDDRYSRRFGAPVRTTVVDVDRANPQATLSADLCDSASLPADAFDCIVLVETLHLLSAPAACLANCQRALVSGGSLLMTVPALKRLSPTRPDSDFWRFTPAGLELLFARTWDGPFTIESFGNLRVCLGFLCAQVVEDLDDDDFARNDPRFPLTVAAQARKA